MEERKVGLIPHAVVQGAMGPKVYGVLVTDRRSILVLELASKAGVGGALGGLVGAAIASATETSRAYDYEKAPADFLAGIKGSIEIPHSSIERMRFKSGALGNRLSVRYRASNGKVKKVEAQISPPSAYVKKEKEKGLGGKEVTRKYMKEAEDVFRRALPITTTSRVEWSE